jgi:hypothetical protein
MMKLANRVLVLTLAFLLISVSVFAQTTDRSKRSSKDPRNTAPTVGTGGPMGGATGLFTVYDGQTLRRGEHTFSAAYSNYDRDPGDADFTEVPISWQVGITNNFELFFNTDAWRGIKVGSPRNLSAFYLPNSNAGNSFPAIVLAPRGSSPGPFSGMAVFRPAGSQPFVQFPYVGGDAGTFGLQPPFFSGPLFGFPAGTNALLGPPVGTSGGASQFPGIGSVYGSILPGVVLQTIPIQSPTGGPAGSAPSVFTLAPSYLPDAPFLNREWGQTGFNTYTVGGKVRLTPLTNPIGFGFIAAYRWFDDNGDTPSGFNQLQRGGSGGGNWGDVMFTLFADARLARWVTMSANVGYHYNSDAKGEFPNGRFVMLDRPSELLTSIGVDFTPNRFFQPILEFRSLRYVGGRTPNAFENHPMDFIGGFRVFPHRWWGFGLAYRYHANQQDDGIFDGESFTGTVTIPCPPDVTGCVPTTITNNFTGVPPGFRTSRDPHGFIFQLWAGRRNERIPEIFNQPANVTALDLSATTLNLPCPPGGTPGEGIVCPDNMMVDVRTTAFDPENDPLIYNYTVSGGRIVGSGANVQWDLSGVSPGTYTITAGVDDGCGICGQTQTRTVTVQECPRCITCECPTLTVTGPAGITKPGDVMTFTANVVGGPAVTYNWTVNRGTIESGQGTPSIRVRTSMADAGQNVTATVTLGITDPDCDCGVLQASDLGPVDTIPTAPLIDEFGALRADDVRARLDAFFIELQNNPGHQGYIINYGTDREIAARERLINNHITFRRFDRSRITLVRGGAGQPGETIYTKLYRVPPGADNPPLDR